ncbi:MAG: hypothetical protein D4R79_14440 [Comamonadaceae bacterium]|nr:MAG: hypothetical protein D4R79_14440 [Comamonadaceae bacterium]
MPAPDQVRGFNSRDPVPRRHWIAGQARNDKKWPPMQTFARKIRLVMHSAQEFLGSEPKFAEPSARPQGAAPCAAAKLVSDPNNSGDSRGAECVASLIHHRLFNRSCAGQFFGMMSVC